MIKVLSDLPTNVVGYAVHGTVDDLDYYVLHPRLKEHGTNIQGGMNLLIDTTAATGLSTKKFWEDAKNEWYRFGNVQRIALVGTPLWTKPFNKLSGMLELAPSSETFSPDQYSQAVAWLAGVYRYQ